MERGSKVETKLFKELPIGQTFRLARRPNIELIKIRNIGMEGSRGVRYNAEYVLPAGAPGKFTYVNGLSKCLIPPYDLGPKPATKWAQLTPLVQAAGWRNIDEMHSAMLAGVVEVPRKGE